MLNMIQSPTYIVKRTVYTFRAGNHSVYFCLSSEKRSALKEKNLHPKGSNSLLLEANALLQSKPLFRRGLMYRNAFRKSQMLYSL